jgi:phospholipid/cholesterol/gamma-HCH transport system substrate-binding protein
VERNALQELKVGLFVFFFLALIVIASFILGGGQNIFAGEYVLHTRYGDVKGMKVGAVVRLAGMDVGEVSRVEFSEDPTVKEIEVDLKIRDEYQPRIREDSVASIQQIGVLGDMYVSITVGSPEKAQLEDGATIQGFVPVDVMSYATTATEIVANAASISKKVDLMLGSDEAASRAEIAKSLENIGLLLVDIQKGRGVLHTLIYDKEAAASIKGILANVEGITGDVNDITAKVRTGDGLVSALIYGKDGRKLTESLDDTLAAVTGLLTDIKTQESLVHSLVYDPARADMVAELQGAATSLNQIMQAVDEGEGTMGLLVRDPQLYEDLRALLGGAQRNALLRGYIRSTIAKQKDENGGAWKAPDPEKK